MSQPPPFHPGYALFRATLFAVALALLQACATAGKAQGPVTAPDIRVGDTWTYNEYDGYNRQLKGTVRYRVKELTGDTVVLTVTHNGKSVTRAFTRDWNPYTGTLVNGRSVDYTPPYPAFDFPLEVGKRWKIETIASDAETGKKTGMTIYAKVLRWERVKTGAGEFDALKVQRLVYVDDREWWRGGTEIAELDWYAPQVKRIVQHVNDSEYRDFTKSADERPLGLGNIIRGDRTRTELVSYAVDHGGE